MTLALACTPDRPDAKPGTPTDQQTIQATAPTTAPAAATAAAAADTAVGSWVGYRFGRFADSVALVGADTLMVADTVFEVQHVRHRSQFMLWISEGRGKGPSGAAEWTVLTVLALPKPLEDERMYVGHCRIDGKRVHRLVARGFWDDGHYFTRINRAWRVNLATRTFDEIPVKGVDCVKLDAGV